MRAPLEPLQSVLFKTALIFGPSGAGKTHFFGTLPKLAWLGSLREDGFTTIQNMERECFYDPKRPPTLYPVNGIEEMMAHLFRDVLPAAAKGHFESIGIELTGHADDVLRLQEQAGVTGWDLYGNLERHIQNIDLRVKALPRVRIWYNALATEPGRETGGPLLAGKQLARKIPAYCSTTAYLRQEETNDGVDRVLHFAAYAGYSPRTRYGNKLPRFVRWRGDQPACMYRDLEDLYMKRASVDASGYVVRSERPALVAVPGASLPALPPLKK